MTVAFQPWVRSPRRARALHQPLGLLERPREEREEGLVRADEPGLRGLSQLARHAVHRRQLHPGRLDVAELDEGVEALLVSVEDALLVAGPRRPPR